MPRIKVTNRRDKSGIKLFEDPNVSTFAKGVASLAQSIAYKRNRDIKELFAIMRESADDIYRAIMELRTQGYCKRKKIGDGVLFKIYLSADVQTSPAKNKTFPESYSKTLAHVPLPPKQIGEREQRELGEGHEPTQAKRSEDEFEDWDNVDVFDDVPLVSQPSFLPARKTNGLVAHDPIPGPAYATMYRICYMVETADELRLLSSGDRGRVTSCLSQLQAAKADLSQLNRFEDWWNRNWRSRSRTQYQPPRPEQVVSHWFEAMRHSTYNLAPKVPATRPSEIEIDLTALMHNKKLSRHND